MDVHNSRYGRMLEIKNIVNREIKQNPKKEYWIQMQLQMEVCNLNECDFLETRFIEYTSEEEYLMDGDEITTENDKFKGKILLFYDNNKPIYEYYVPEIHKNYEIWESEQFTSHSDHLFMKTIFWKLDEFSCILVLRNKKWFNSAVKIMEDVWNIIEDEKNNGYEHRAPTKRVRKNSISSSDSKCLINISNKLKDNL
jgi:hypothetical protein